VVVEEEDEGFICKRDAPDSIIDTRWLIDR
jgi:hypothetical protein